jgi:hypothetical protein
MIVSMSSAFQTLCSSVSFKTVGRRIRQLRRIPNGAHDDVVDTTTQALNYLRVKPELWAIVLGPSSFDRELDRKALWEKAMLGYPMTEAEIARM